MMIAVLYLGRSHIHFWKTTCTPNLNFALFTPLVGLGPEEMGVLGLGQSWSLRRGGHHVTNLVFQNFVTSIIPGVRPLVILWVPSRRRCWLNRRWRYPNVWGPSFSRLRKQDFESSFICQHLQRIFLHNVGFYFPVASGCSIKLRYQID